MIIWGEITEIFFSLFLLFDTDVGLFDIFTGLFRRVLLSETSFIGLFIDGEFFWDLFKWSYRWVNFIISL